MEFQKNGHPAAPTEQRNGRTPLNSVVVGRKMVFHNKRGVWGDVFHA